MNGNDYDATLILQNALTKRKDATSLKVFCVHINKASALFAYNMGRSVKIVAIYLLRI